MRPAKSVVFAGVVILRAALLTSRRPGALRWSDQSDDSKRRVVVVVALIELHAPALVHA